MSKVYTGASMSIDGFIAGPGNSGFEIPSEIHPELSLKLTETSAAYIREITELSGAIVVGRKLWDFTNAWGGKHPMGVPVVVLTHSVPDGWEREGEWFTFITEGGVAAAIAKARELAGDEGVGLHGGDIAEPALDRGQV